VVERERDGRTNTLGIPLGSAADERRRPANPTGGYEQRQLQLGFKLTF
jgi:hypothetical protein